MINTLTKALGFTLVVIWTMSCESDSKQLGNYIELINANKKFSIDKEGWTIRHTAIVDNIRYYDVYKKNSDTIINLSFQIYLMDESFVIEDYRKFIYSKQEDCFYSIRFNPDTLYCYRVKDLSHQTDKKFIVGKYYYLYLHNQLSIGQKAFFEANFDSLVLVKGNDLPDLPVLY